MWGSRFFRGVYYLHDKLFLVEVRCDVGLCLHKYGRTCDAKHSVVDDCSDCQLTE